MAVPVLGMLGMLTPGSWKVIWMTAFRPGQLW